MYIYTIKRKCHLLFLKTPTANPTKVQMIIPGGPPYIPFIAPSPAPSNPLFTIATRFPSSEIFPPLKLKQLQLLSDYICLRHFVTFLESRIVSMSALVSGCHESSRESPPYHMLFFIGWGYNIDAHLQTVGMAYNDFGYQH